MAVEFQETARREIGEGHSVFVGRSDRNFEEPEILVPGLGHPLAFHQDPGQAEPRRGLKIRRFTHRNGAAEGLLGRLEISFPELGPLPCFELDPISRRGGGISLDRSLILPGQPESAVYDTGGQDDAGVRILWLRECAGSLRTTDPELVLKVFQPLEDGLTDGLRRALTFLGHLHSGELLLLADHSDRESRQDEARHEDGQNEEEERLSKSPDFHGRNADILGLILTRPGMEYVTKMS